jgi:acetyl esterase/lipase
MSTQPPTKRPERVTAPIPLDPEIAAALAAMAEEMGAIQHAKRGDALAARALGDAILEATFAQLPDAPDVTFAEHVATAEDGHEIPLRFYRRSASDNAACVVFAHGGGMIMGTLDNYDRAVRHHVQLTGVPFLAVGYRLAPEFPGTIPATDVFTSVRWLHESAPQLGLDATRIALMGDSGGGAVAAGAAILARDHGVSLAKQILIYPMLDDRNVVPDELLTPTAVWTYDQNYTGWRALLGGDLGGPSVSPVASPARLTDFVGLASAYIQVPELDIFRDEGNEYAHSLMRAGVSCELHVFPGAPHEFEWLSPEAAVSRRAVADRMRVIESL